MKTRFFTAAIALCLLGFTGCNKERMNDAGTQTGTPVMMTLQTGSPETRADYTEDGNTMKFSWRANDAISVVVNGVSGNENCELTTTAEGKSVSFSGTVAPFTGTKDIYPIYPYNSTAYTITNGDTPAAATVALTLPNPQSYTVGGAIANSYLVGAGKATATDTDIEASAGMKQVMSFIKLNITNATGKKVTGVKLSCAEALFPTTATVKLSDASISNPGTNVKELTMNVTDGTDTDTKTVSFAMFPADLTNKKIQVSVWFADGTGLTIEKDGTDFKRNEHYSMAVDASTAAIRIGAFYLNDKTIVDKDATLATEQKTKCIGIVFYLNPNGTGGKIVGLDEPIANWNSGPNAAGKLKWGDGGDGSANDELNGLVNMATIKALDNTFTAYPAFAWVHAKNSSIPNLDYSIAPTGVWYLPAAKELRQLYAAMSGLKWVASGAVAANGEIDDWGNNTPMDNYSDYADAHTAFNALFTAVGKTTMDLSDSGYYWSSTEVGVSSARYVYFDLASTLTNDKGYTNKVRAVLAF